MANGGPSPLLNHVFTAWMGQVFNNGGIGDAPLYLFVDNGYWEHDTSPTGYIRFTLDTDEVVRDCTLDADDRTLHHASGDYYLVHDSESGLAELIEVP